MALDRHPADAVRGSNPERSRITRHHIVTGAKRRFGRDGYAAVSVDDIAADAGVTKGAVYHHFGSKAGVLEAVLADAHRRMRRRVALAVRPLPDARARILVGCDAYLEAVGRPDATARLVFIEAPAVLGWARWRELDEQVWRRDLHDATLNVLGKDDPRAATVVYAASAVLVDAALKIASGAEAQAVRDQAQAAIALVLDAAVRTPGTRWSRPR